MKFSHFLYVLFLGSLLTGCGTTSQDTQSNGSMSTITQSPFGLLPDGQQADLFILRNNNGVEVRITNYGGIITHWLAPDKNGQLADIVLGYDSLAGYLKDTPYFGAIVGRYGNRIGRAKFTLDGSTYTLAANNGPNSLHGGNVGFDKKLWKAQILGDTLQLTYLSPDGEEGFPGNLTCEVRYRLTNDNTLQIEYQATTDKPTVVNLTNHTYFNLTGGLSDVLLHEVQIEADRFVPVDKTLIPTGALASVKGTPFDFLKSTAIGARINDSKDEQLRRGGGYDHCWVATDSSHSLKAIASVYEPTSGRYLEVWTTEPAIQFYTGNFLNGSITGKNNVVYQKRWGFCLETEHYPDSPNQPQFPSVVLRPGQTYYTKTTYRITTKTR
ncbi:MAG: aldose epimerase family protein [Runella sp.]